MKYTISTPKPHLRYINITAVLENVTDELVEIQLSAWRPGRYELANFAKNVRNFTVENAKGAALPFNKVKKDLWHIQTNGSEEIVISYEYFADKLDAGSTYTDEKVLYVNPVNCLVYEPSTYNNSCELVLDIPDNFKIACALPQNNNTLKAENFDELADSPLIASAELQHNTFEHNGVTHHIWINGENTLDIETFAKEVEEYTKEQVAVFNHFPTKDFHYLIHFLPYRYRHGVEHKNSTVIVHGPGNEFHLPENRRDLLAICSHELFHFWNIKRIRPAVMYPYDFTKENYSVLGYVYEGVTTYYGDYMLLRSKVLNFEEYSVEFSKDIQRHFNNYGRYNYSVAESSFDTWLDGYALGAPARKVSIYVEGMLAALIADIKIREASQHKHSLDTVMKLMYDRFYLKDKGYNEQDYLLLLEEVSGVEMSQYFEDIIWGKGKVEQYLPESLNKIGLEIKEEASAMLHEKYFGFKTTTENGVLQIAYCLDNSPADNVGLGLNNIIKSINGKVVSSDEELSAEVAKNPNDMKLVVKSLFTEKEIVLNTNGEHYFNNYSLVKTYDATAQQKEFFKAWCKQEF